MQVPPANKGDACDVEIFAEYEDVVKKILEKQPTKAIVIFVDMKDVEKAANKKDSGDSDDETDEDEEPVNNGSSKIESELARYRGLLEKQYSNDHDAGYTYIDPIAAESIPLTPFMMKEWARVMYDGTATVHQPPNTQTFDPAMRKSSLPLARRNRSESASASVNSSGGSSDLAHFSQILSNVISIAHGSSNKFEPPTTPTHSRAPAAVLWPIHNTPSKLPRFLKYAETTLGIKNARTYEESLQMMGYGPDILHLVDNTALKDIGIMPGDAIRLKQHSLSWLDGVGASSLDKRKRTPSPNPVAAVMLTPPNKKVRFEKRFHDGGSSRLYGPSLMKGDMAPGLDYDWYYYCDAAKAMVSLPVGYVPMLDGDEHIWD